MRPGRPFTIAALLAPLLLLAGGWLIFYALKEQPFVRNRCLGAHPDDIEAYRDGLGAYASASAAVLAALIVCVSRAPATLVALGGCAGLAVLYNVHDDAFIVHSLPAFGLLVFGGELVLLVSAGLAIGRRSRLALLIHLWMWLLIGLPALAGYPAGAGTAGLCL